MFRQTRPDQPVVSLCFCYQNFEEYPEHRTHFFYLLQAVNSHCFPAFLAIPPAQFKLVLDSIIWAFKHTMRNVADTGKSPGTHLFYTFNHRLLEKETLEA